MIRKPILYIMSGLPGCGKSTWANEFIREHDARYVSRDEIRLSLLNDDEDYFAHENEVFQHFAKTIYQTLTDGFDVIADATHLNKGSRKKLIKALRGVEFDIIYVCFNTSFVTCLNRNNMREGRARVPIEAMEDMWDRYEKPLISENPHCIGVWEIGEN